MTGFTLPANVYNFIKYLVLIVLPALTTLYVVVATQWEWDNITNISVTMTAITAFLGTIVGISARNFNNSERYVGETYLEPTDAGWKRVFNVTADEIDPTRKEISFKVVDSQAS
jgi:hypothetical protein